MSRAKAMTLGEEAYNTYLNLIDPRRENVALPRWPEHLTEKELRHWHTAVGPNLRKSKPHYRYMAAGDLKPPRQGVLSVYYMQDGKWKPWNTSRPSIFQPDTYLWVRCGHDHGKPLAIPAQ